MHKYQTIQLTIGDYEACHLSNRFSSGTTTGLLTWSPKLHRHKINHPSTSKQIIKYFKFYLFQPPVENKGCHWRRALLAIERNRSRENLSGFPSKRLRWQGQSSAHKLQFSANVSVSIYLFSPLLFLTVLLKIIGSAVGVFPGHSLIARHENTLNSIVQFVRTVWKVRRVGHIGVFVNHFAIQRKPTVLYQLPSRGFTSHDRTQHSSHNRENLRISFSVFRQGDRVRENNKAELWTQVLG